jgi:hypothetical protein
MNNKTKQRIRSGHYKRKRERAYKESAFANFIVGLAFIAGGVFNEGSPGGTVFMFVIGGLMMWCAYSDSKGEKLRKTSPRAEAMFKRTNERLVARGLEPFERPDDIPEQSFNEASFPFGALAILICLIIAALSN